VGGLAGREFDESFPLRFGLCGDEGLSAGGLSAALRAWPVVESWLAAVALHAPKALVLIVSSPVGILVRAAARRFPALHCLGICEVPFVQLREICDALAVDLEAVAFDYLGVNHLGWLYCVEAGRRDLIAEWAAMPMRRGFPSAALLAQWNAIPTKYMRLHFEGEQVLAAQRSALESRSSALMRLQEAAHAVYETGSREEVRAAISRRQTPWYSDAVAPLLIAMTRSEDSNGLFFLSGLNKDSALGFSADDVLEFPYTVRRAQPHRLPTRRLPSVPIADQVRSFCRYERLATDAVLDSSQRALEVALAVHPWIAPLVRGDFDFVPGLARRVVDGCRI
jgi:6-phospho-beta-glucosidase